jgi:hypothetical protein
MSLPTALSTHTTLLSVSQACVHLGVECPVVALPDTNATQQQQQQQQGHWEEGQRQQQQQQQQQEQRDAWVQSDASSAVLEVVLVALLGEVCVCVCVLQLLHPMSQKGGTPKELAKQGLNSKGPALRVWCVSNTGGWELCHWGLLDRCLSLLRQR